MRHCYSIIVKYVIVNQFVIKITIKYDNAFNSILNDENAVKYGSLKLQLGKVHLPNGEHSTTD